MAQIRAAMGAPLKSWSPTIWSRAAIPQKLSSAPIFFFPTAIFLRSPPRCTLATMSSGAADVDAIFAQKKALRSKLKRDLKSMDSSLRSQEDEQIQNVVLQAPWFKDCKSLCAYISCSTLREVDTSVILARILQTQSKDKKKLYVPRVEDRNRNMRMLNISSTKDLIANSMNILEPCLVDSEGNEREEVLLANEPVDLFLLPGLGFDKFGRRLGRGGGEKTKCTYKLRTNGAHMLEQQQHASNALYLLLLLKKIKGASEKLKWWEVGL